MRGGRRRRAAKKPTRASAPARAGAPRAARRGIPTHLKHSSTGRCGLERRGRRVGRSERESEGAGWRCAPLQAGVRGCASAEARVALTYCCLVFTAEQCGRFGAARARFIGEESGRKGRVPLPPSRSCVSHAAKFWLAPAAAAPPASRGRVWGMQPRVAPAGSSPRALPGGVCPPSLSPSRRRDGGRRAWRRARAGARCVGGYDVVNCPLAL